MASQAYDLRELDRFNSAEVDSVVERLMLTVLETCPEFEGDAQKAHAAFGNFTFEQMKAMLESSLQRPEHRALVAVDGETGKVLGHAVFSVKTDAKGQKYGFCFSRYVQPSARRRGIASALLQAQIQWWREQGAVYAVAQTHTTNHKLQALFAQFGFEASGPIQGQHFSYYSLYKKL